jgi:hypothetical protein
MPSVTPENRPATPAQEFRQDLSQAAAPRGGNSLTNLVRVGVASMALTNSEPALAQSPIAPNPPPGHPAYYDVQQPNGTIVRYPVVSSIPQGYVPVQPRELPTYPAQQPVAQHGSLPVYNPQATTQPAVGQAQTPAANITTAPMASGAQGVAPVGNLQVVSYGPGGVPAGAQPTLQTAPGAPGFAPAPGISSTIPNSHGIVQPVYGQVHDGAAQATQSQVYQLRNEAELRRLQGQMELNELRHQETIENIQRRRVLNGARTAETLDEIARRRAQKDYNEGVQRTGSWVGGELFRWRRSQ